MLHITGGMEGGSQFEQGDAAMEVILVPVLFLSTEHRAS